MSSPRLASRELLVLFVVRGVDLSLNLAHEQPGPRIAVSLVCNGCNARIWCEPDALGLSTIPRWASSGLWSD